MKQIAFAPDPPAESSTSAGCQSRAMALIDPTPEEAAQAMTHQVNREKLRRELERVFADNVETVKELDEGALTEIVLDALHRVI